MDVRGAAIETAPAERDINNKRNLEHETANDGIAWIIIIWLLVQWGAEQRLGEPEWGQTTNQVVN